MQPRTLVIVVTALLAGAIGLRMLVVRFGLLPVSEEIVLKKAVALTLRYYHRGIYTNLMITDAKEVQEALETLQIQGAAGQRYYGGPAPTQTTITFYFPDRTIRSHAIESPHRLGSFPVHRAFYEKLRDIASRRAGQNIEILAGMPDRGRKLP